MRVLVIDDSNNTSFVDVSNFVFNKSYIFNGEVKFFSDLDSWTLFKNKYNINDDSYIIVPEGFYLRSGYDGLTGGNNKILNDNLPLKEFVFSLSSIYVRSFGKMIPTVLSGLNTNVNVSSYNTGFDIQGINGVSANTYQVSWSYGFEIQQDFLPKYQNVIVIKFIKDVEINV